MSRAFIKEDHFVDELPERPISEYPNDVTPRGLALIRELLESARRTLAEGQIAVDRNAVSLPSRELRYWSARLSTARLIETPPNVTRAQFGATVTIARDDGRKQTFQIVGEDEADPSQGTISHVSPLARALFGKVVGEVISVGSGEAEVVAIR